MQVCLRCCQTFAWASRDHSVEGHEQKLENFLPSCRDVKVVGIEKFGLFVEFLPSRPGLLHTSELANNEDLNDFDINDIIDVMLLAVSLLSFGMYEVFPSDAPMVWPSGINCFMLCSAMARTNVIALLTQTGCCCLAGGCPEVQAQPLVSERRWSQEG